MLLPLMAGCPTEASSDGEAGSSDGTSTGPASPTSDSSGGPSTGADSDTDADADTGAATDAGGDTGSSSGSDGEETTAGIECAATHVCVAAVPDGWQGPVALQSIDVDGEPECGGNYSELESGMSLSGLTAAPFECDCVCGSGTVACTGTARVRMSGESPISGLSPCTMSGALGGPASLFTANVSSASPIQYAYGTHDYEGSGLHGVTVDMVDIDPVGGCAPMPSERATSADWGGRTIACTSPDAMPACGAGNVCAPRPLAPFEQAVCIWSEGDEECPAEYPAKTLRHRNYTDDRECSACSCGSPNANCEDPTVRVGVSNSVGGPSFDIFDAPNPYCEQLQIFVPPFISPPLDSVTEVSLDAGELAFASQSAPCPPQGGDPVGDAVPIQPVTYCCTAP